MNLTQRVLRTGVIGVTMLGMTLGITGTANADPRLSASIESWADAVWHRADDTNLRVREASDLIPMPPSGGGADLLGFEESRAAFEQTLNRREQDRAQRIAEVRGELQEALAESDERAAIAAIVELHVLSVDKDAVLRDPSNRAVIERAERSARRAEDEGSWLTALALYSQLNVLFETQQTYEDELRRLGNRIAMLRLYVPERLHDLRSAEREREGEDPLPPFNEIGEDWREKLSGISQDIVIKALMRAENEHVERTPLSDMLGGGLDALRTLATTTDLSLEFPPLRDVNRLGEFLAEIDFVKSRMTRPERSRANPLQSIVSTLEAVLAANARTVQLPEEVIMHEFGNGAIGVLDEYSTIIWPDERKQFERALRGAFTGVGIQISLNEALELEVVTPLSGTPAFNAGIRAKDVISKIDGAPTLGINLNQAVDRITGPAGTQVVLSIQRPGVDEELDVPLVRARIPIHSVKGWRRTGEDEVEGWDYFVDADNGIGYIRLTQFTKDTSREMRSVIRSMQRQGLNGLILDLRYNPGGLLSEAVRVVNMFADDGNVVTQEDRDGRTVERYRARFGGQIVEDDTPVVVLINEGSASASEIVAGALQDFDRAVLIGDRTFGKGSVQQVFEVGRRPAALFKLTTGYYKLPNGRLVHRARNNVETWGVEPDVMVEMLPEQIGDALELRRDADAYRVDEATGRPTFENPMPLVNEGLDPQLEASLLLLRSQVAADRAIARISAADRDHATP